MVRVQQISGLVTTYLTLTFGLKLKGVGINKIIELFEIVSNSK